MITHTALAHLPYQGVMLALPLANTNAFPSFNACVCIILVRGGVEVGTGVIPSLGTHGRLGAAHEKRLLFE